MNIYIYNLMVVMLWQTTSMNQWWDWKDLTSISIPTHVEHIEDDVSFTFDFSSHVPENKFKKINIAIYFFPF